MTDIPVVLAGETLPAGKLQAFGGLETPYTPTLTASITSPNLGTGGTAVGSWSQNGSMIDLFVRIDFGSSGVTAGSGDYRISLPTAVPADPDWSPGDIGLARLADLSAAARQNRWAVLDTTTRMVIQDSGGGTVTNAVPWTWAATDWIVITARYRLAA